MIFETEGALGTARSVGPPKNENTTAYDKLFINRRWHSMRKYWKMQIAETLLAEQWCYLMNLQYWPYPMATKWIYVLHETPTQFDTSRVAYVEGGFPNYVTESYWLRAKTRAHPRVAIRHGLSRRMGLCLHVNLTYVLRNETRQRMSN